jgi:hypothetical protein
MPKGPKGQRCPADVIGNAIRVAQIATGEAEEDMPKSGKDPTPPLWGAREARLGLSL